MNNSNRKFTFEEIFKQNENRIYYQMHKLGIHDPHNEFYTEGLYAMWRAHKKYNPNKGPMATYFNYSIRYHLIDKLRSKTREFDKQDKIIEEHRSNIYNGNTYGLMKLPVVDFSGIKLDYYSFWKRVKSHLTENQWKWVCFYIIHGMSLKEIAEHENVSV